MTNINRKGGTMNEVQIKSLSCAEIMQQYRTPREKNISWFRHIYRYFGVVFTKALLYTSITPNQVSFFALFIGLPGALLLSSEGYGVRLIGLLLIQLSFTLDFADGTLARIKGLSSSSGDYLDSVVNSLVATVVLFCIGLGNYHLLGVKAVVLGFCASTGALFIKFCYATKLRSVLSLEKDKVRKALNNLEKKPAVTSSVPVSKTPFRKFIIKLEYVTWNYIYVLNYLTLAIIFKLDFVVLIFYGITFPLYAFFVFWRLYKVDSKETIDWIVNPELCN